MHAVILTGGKQYRVQEGQTLKVEKLPLETGAQVDLDKVLMVSDGEVVNIGKPYVQNAQVSASVLRHGRNKKVKIIKFRRRKHYMRTMGHRQWFTELKITVIKADQASKSSKKDTEE